METKPVVFALIFLLIPTVVLAGSVTRSIKQVDDNIVVDLVVDVGVETYYVIDDVYPESLSVVNNGGGDNYTNKPHIFWVVLQNAQDTTYEYILHPAQSGAVYYFSGSYGFEGGTEITIVGQTSITVGANFLQRLLEIIRRIICSVFGWFGFCPP